MKTKISIIIPNYNHAEFLPQRLDTVFNQTYQNIEVILLDDASTDTSKNILQNYANHPKVSHVIYNKINTGNPFQQWERGIRLAEGEYIWIAESDDFNDLNFLESCLKSINKESNIGIVSTSLIIFTEDTQTLIQPMQTGIYNGKDCIKDKMLKGNNLRNASGIIFLRESVTDHLLQQISNYKICGDWFLWLSILKNYNLSFIARPLTNYRKHPTSTTFNLKDNVLFFSEINKLLEMVIKWKEFSKSFTDQVVWFWLKKIKKSNIEIKTLQNLESQYNKLLYNKIKGLRFKQYLFRALK